MAAARWGTLRCGHLVWCLILHESISGCPSSAEVEPSFLDNKYCNTSRGGGERMTWRLVTKVFKSKSEKWQVWRSVHRNVTSTIQLKCEVETNEKNGIICKEAAKRNSDNGLLAFFHSPFDIGAYILIKNYFGMGLVFSRRNGFS